MNLAHFHMRLRPFRASPDTRFYYPSAAHEAVLGQMQQALEDDAGLVLLTGAPGTGKTLLAHVLLERLGANVCSALITNCRFAGRRDLLQAILFDLGLPYQDKSEQELRLILTENALKNYSAGQPTVIVLDEAQDLSIDLLEELRLLSNLDTSRGKAVQVVLIAQSPILLTLRSPELAVFAQRLHIRLHLDSLDVHEAGDYLRHQLRVAGADADSILSDEALSLLAKYTSGLPRMLNQAAAQALHFAQMQQVESVDAEAALEALNSLGLEVELDVPQEEATLAEAETKEELESGEAQGAAPPLPAASGFPTPGSYAVPRDIANAYIYQPGEPVKAIFGENG
jgi:type II secretory pathway predicted ATPase ExeA